MRDTNKRLRVATTGELETQHKKKTETARPSGTPASSPANTAFAQKRWSKEEKRIEKPSEEVEGNVEDKAGGDVPDRDISKEIADIGHRNEQLQLSVAALKRKFYLRKEETQQLMLGLGALNAVANELAALQADYRESSSKNAALIQESLSQLSNCSAQVDMLKRCREFTVAQLEAFRHECTQEMNKLVARLGDLADSANQEPETFDGNDVTMDEKRQQIKLLKDELCEYRAQVSHDGSVASAPSTAGLTHLETTERINLALAQLDELHAEMYQLKQALVQENQYFRQDLGDLVSQQMACVREVQDNEAERIHEEMDHMRSGMCGVLKDIHRLKERTKYLVPSMARVGPRSISRGPLLHETRLFGERSGEQIDERQTDIPTDIFQSSGYSMTMATRQCQDHFPHYEHGYDDDSYCPGVIYTQTGACYARPRRPRSSRSSISSLGHSEDENGRMVFSDDAHPTDQRHAQPCESPHYSACSSSLSGRLSVNDDERPAPSAEQFEQQLWEQHRLFWISEGAG